MTSVLAHAVIWIPVAAITAVLMDFWAAFLHHRVWHAWLWSVHSSHHTPRPEGERLEQNDALSFLHAPPAIALIFYGCRAAPSVLRKAAFGLGIGMTLFGIGYVLVHDGLVHGRLPMSSLLRLRYFRAVVRAHHVHHTGTAGGAPYGFFFGRFELTRSRLTRSPRRSVPSRDSSGQPRRAPDHT